MACISSLPTELMRKIITSSSRGDDDSMANISNARTNLRAVCSHWDTIITSSPEFWCKFNFNYVTSDDTLQPVCSPRVGSPQAFPPIDVVKLWLKRSGEAPLEISFRFHWRMHYRYQLLETLALHIGSWVKFSLLLDYAIAPKFSQLPLRLASRLEELNIEARGHVEISNSMHNALKSLPPLRCLALTGFSSCEELPTLFPLHRLSRLDLSSAVAAHPKDILSIMRHCTSATEIAIQTGVSDIQAFGTSVSLSNLQILDLLVKSPIVGAFEKMILPNLRVFRLKYWPNMAKEVEECAMLADLRRYFIDATHALEVLRIEDLSYYSSGQLGTFLGDSNVLVKIADTRIVQVCAVFEQYSDRSEYDTLVRDCKCDRVRQRFKLRTWATQRGRQTVRMGWADYETYHFYEDFFSKWSTFTIDALFTYE